MAPEGAESLHLPVKKTEGIDIFLITTSRAVASPTFSPIATTSVATASATTSSSAAAFPFFTVIFSVADVIAVSVPATSAATVVLALTGLSVLHTTAPVVLPIVLLQVAAVSASVPPPRLGVLVSLCELLDKALTSSPGTSGPGPRAAGPRTSEEPAEESIANSNEIVPKAAARMRRTLALC
eukprot:CAMPEP_0115092200 /NCGR_PEP_ID=MMETSP0227-20121206/26606_1 /TAXON_ID=89957 /ORGANISM="Polarella glacialis, Strain CCMP 1383" /LENGTH=181 /DNA_ID=CAMNT_0002483937 /DNA_START=49 /DNA_END=596 /DNA_ORIENTATION=-